VKTAKEAAKSGNFIRNSAWFSFSAEALSRLTALTSPVDHPITNTRSGHNWVSRVERKDAFNLVRRPTVCAKVLSLRHS
jgi:hypothetical protein